MPIIIVNTHVYISSTQYLESWRSTYPRGKLHRRRVTSYYPQLPLNLFHGLFLVVSFSHFFSRVTISTSIYFHHIFAQTNSLELYFLDQREQKHVSPISNSLVSNQNRFYCRIGRRYLSQWQTSSLVM